MRCRTYLIAALMTLFLIGRASAYQKPYVPWPWVHADNLQYPEKYSTLGFRIGVNYVIYAMTH
jgi:hypothetical protein